MAPGIHDGVPLLTGETVIFNVSIRNASDASVATLPLNYRFNPTCLTFQAAEGISRLRTLNAVTSELEWTDLTRLRNAVLPPAGVWSLSIQFQATGECQNTVNTAIVGVGRDVNDRWISGLPSTVSFSTSAPGNISGVVFEDSNRNGLRETDEIGRITEVMVACRAQATSESFTATSSAAGVYVITGLRPDAYNCAAPAEFKSRSRTTPAESLVSLPFGATQRTLDIGYAPPPPLAVTSLSARRFVDDGVYVEWSTLAEQGLQGYVVWRAVSLEQGFTAVSDVRSALNRPQGASYRWWDPSADTTTRYWYQVQSLPDGRFFGPVQMSGGG